MAKVITFSALPYEALAPGVQTAAITGAQGGEMQADVLRLAPGAKHADTVPQGSDRYLYTLTGEAALEANGITHMLREDTFATL